MKWICLIFICSLTGAACRNNTDRQEVKALQKALQENNKLIVSYTDATYEELKQRAADLTDHRAAIWAKNGHSLHIASMDVLSCIDSLQRSHADDVLARQTLGRRLTNYRNTITAIFRPDSIQYPTAIPLPAIESQLKEPISLDRLRSEVLVTEDKLAKRCLLFISYRAVRCDYFHPFAGLSSSYVKRGDSITLEIGLCSPYPADGLKFFADGHPIPVPTNDYAVEYKFVANGAPGKHILPIRFEFLKPDSSQAILQKNMKYEIAP